MVLYEKELQVVNVGRITDVSDGSLIYQVAFGNVVTPAQGTGTPSGSKEVASNTVIVYFKSDKEAPYKVGSKWKVRISDSGNVALSKV